MQFKEITGQEDVKKRLIQTVRDSRVSHAQLFLGPEGTGKLALAIAYAQYINCKNRTAEDACGTCSSCIKYNKLAHPDLHFVYPVSNTQKVKTKATSKDFAEEWRQLLLEKRSYINLADWHNKIGIENKQAIINAEDCNQIIKTLSYKSYESEYKVMIIWMVEKLFHAAAPKILKILEEPPEKTLFILVSENQYQIINTILSRAQLIKIPKLEDVSLQMKLQETYHLGGKEAKEVSRLAEGNMIRAEKIIREDENEKYNFDQFVKWMRICFAGKVIDINDFVTEMARIGREKQKHFFTSALRIARNSLLMNYQLDDLVNNSGNEKDFMQKFHPFINGGNIHQISDELNKAVYHIERNANPSILFMDLSLKISALIRDKAS